VDPRSLRQENDELRRRLQEIEQQLPGLSPSEAVFGFVSWITTRDGVVKAGAAEDASKWAELADEFCKANGLAWPRDDWTEHLKHPES
jgi:hypothetical protein